ncbi:MAG: hypothetical protein OdinLCB4_001030 [Candidatus Odinarchaeum yellowstonii]|uniref:Uncharacterized protein n=1 Tax=Odinarchaeota yellowstonii (strain LCB_4) TaxID=1841599 RepID=A0AAF0D2K1_ODILC|nr:MAG: hypothetical protein OdinLCB4_001030 [Candidatus Odinarchaeum yellowstonii]
MLVGEFALDPFNRDAGTGSVYRVNVGPNNPAEAWIPGGGRVYILDNGPLFVRIRIITSDGGYESGTYTVNNRTANIHMSITGHTDIVYPSNPGNHGSGFFNYTYTYRFYYHGPNLLAELDQAIQVNIQPMDGAIPQAYVKNYGDWPHICTFTSNTTAGAALQNMHAWYGSKYFLFNESSYARRRDFPLEKWCAWYDNESGSDPSIGIITTNDTTGWEVLSLVVSGIGPNIMLQQILREGHQGDMYLMPNGSVYRYHYFIYTSAFGSNYTEIRSMAQNLNNRVLVSQLDSKLDVVNPTSMGITLPATDTFQLSVNFTNPVNNQGINDASVVYYADWLPAETWTAMFETDPDRKPGLYERTVTAPSDLGEHIITIKASKLGYPTCTLNITVNIVAKTRVTLSATALSLTPGEGDKIYVRYERVDRGFNEPVEDAVFNITGWSYGYEVKYLGEGLYEIRFTTTVDASPSSYNVHIRLGLPNYESQDFNVTVIVKAAPPPVIFDKLIVYSALAAIGAVAVYGIYNYHFKYPPIIRKLRKLLKKIVKRKIPTKMIKVRGREQILADILANQRRVISGIEVESGEEAGISTAFTGRVETHPSELELGESEGVEFREKTPSESEKPLGESLSEDSEILKRVKSIKGISEEEIASVLKELKGLTPEEVNEFLKNLEELYDRGGND